MVWVRDGIDDVLARAGLLVLDIDGVLVDPRPSFYTAAREASWWAATNTLGREAGRPVNEAEIAAFKAAGGWNDDFELATGCAWALVAREVRVSTVLETAAASAGGLPVLVDMMIQRLPTALLQATAIHCAFPIVRDRAAARYSGRGKCLELYGIDPETQPDAPEAGLWEIEPALVDPALVKDCGLELAFFTGRNGPETRLIADRFALDVAPDRRMVDDGMVSKKPNPQGLLLLAQGRQDALVFVGDSIDDQNAALAYRQKRPDGAPIAFVRVVGAEATEEEVQAAIEAGADVVVDALDSFLRDVLAPRRQQPMMEAR